MALRLRRGLDIERQSITFAEGEPLYTTDTKQLYVGDGSTVGGNLVTGIKSLLEDTTPQLGNNLDLNNNNITGVGNIDIVGDLTIKGGLNADFILADYRGSLFGNDSTMLVDGNQGIITASVVSGDVPLVDVDTKLINLNFTPLESLQDVKIVNPQIGDTLQYQSDGWHAQPFGTDPITQLPPPNNSLLQYTSSNGWVGSNKIIADDSSVLIDLASGEVYLGSSSIQTFSDVFIDNSSLQPNEVLTWDGDFWTHKEIDVSHINLTSIVIDNISNVNVPAPSSNEILKFDGTQWTNGTLGLSDLDDIWIDETVPLEMNQILSWDGFHFIVKNNSLQDLTDTYIQNNPEMGSVLYWDGFHWIGMVITDLISGSTYESRDVIAADSTVIINSSTSAITASSLEVDRIHTEQLETDSLDIRSYVGQSSLRMERVDNTISFANNFANSPLLGEKLGMIRFTSSSILDTPNEMRNVYISAYTGGLILCHSFNNGTIPEEYVTLAEGNLNVGSNVKASEKLEVHGNTKVHGFVQFGSLTTVERDALTAENGMVIYNTDVNKFQGSANGTWVDLH